MFKLNSNWYSVSVEIYMVPGTEAEIGKYKLTIDIVLFMRTQRIIKS